MPITTQEINEHYAQHGLHDLVETPKAQFRQAVENGAFFYVDHHGFVRITFTGEIIATNQEQLYVLLEQLQNFCEKMGVYRR